MPNGILYVVATPIGNLSDITFRAVEILKSVDFIACEDTRNSSVLCDRYDIKTRLISYHKFSENERLELFLGYLREGKTIALISDAGTPLISDPGSKLVEKVREEGFKVVPIGGISAVTTLLSAIAREEESFKFTGFLPRSEKQIEELLEANRCENLVFYESPKRLLKSLEVIKKTLDNPKIAIGRELTKKFEEIIVDDAESIISHFSENTLKGEIVGMIYAQKKSADEDEIIKKIKQLKQVKLSNKEIAVTISELYGYPKNKVYDLVLAVEI